jgi:hypothetical protein
MDTHDINKYMMKRRDIIVKIVTQFPLSVSTHLLLLSDVRHPPPTPLQAQQHAAHNGRMVGSQALYDVMMHRSPPVLSGCDKLERAAGRHPGGPALAALAARVASLAAKAESREEEGRGGILASPPATATAAARRTTPNKSKQPGVSLQASPGLLSPGPRLANRGDADADADADAGRGAGGAVGGVAGAHAGRLLAPGCEAGEMAARNQGWQASSRARSLAGEGAASSFQRRPRGAGAVINVHRDWGRSEGAARLRRRRAGARTG